MKINKKELKIIADFKNRVQQEFPGEIVELVLFGSKARGDASPASDIDLLLITASEDWKKADKIRSIGYTMDPHMQYALSIHAISKKHADYLREKGFCFLKNVTQTGIPV